ncbi:hypothetical protein MMC2321_02224 [Chitinophaga sp. MM2321]
MTGAGNLVVKWYSIIGGQSLLWLIVYYGVYKL